MTTSIPPGPPPPWTFPSGRPKRRWPPPLIGSRAQNGPWFLWVHLYDPHSPYAPPEPYATRFAADPYSGEVAYVDETLGKLFGAIDGRGETGRTLVVLTADHGESLGEHGEMTHGYFAYNSTIRVPLVVAGAGLAPARVKDLVSHEDIFPTVCDVLGLAAPADLPGRSFRPLLEGRTRKARPVYFEALEGYYHRGAAPLRGVIDGAHEVHGFPDPGALRPPERLRRSERPRLRGRTSLAIRRSSTGRWRGRPRRTEAGPPPRPTGKPPSACAAWATPSGPPAPPGRTSGPRTTSRRSCRSSRSSSKRPTLAKEGRPDESARLLEDLIAARPGFTRAYAQLAELEYSLGRRRRASPRPRAGRPGQSRRLHHGLGPRHRPRRAAAISAAGSRSSAAPWPSSTKTRTSGAPSPRPTGRRASSIRPTRLSQGPGPGPRRRDRQRQSRQSLCRVGAADPQRRPRQAVLRPFRDGPGHRSLPRVGPQRPRQRLEDRRRYGQGGRELGEGRLARSGLRPSRL